MSSNNIEKKLYIVLSQSYTVLSRIIKFVTKDEYSHVSLSFDKSCTCMYTMGRKFARYPFWGKYMEEDIYKGLYKVSKNAKILIYELDITNEQYESINTLIKQYGEESKGYNFIGLVFALFDKRINRKKYYCSEFIYKVLSDQKVQIYPEEQGAVKPMDFTKIEGLKKIYEGKVSDYKKIVNDNELTSKKLWYNNSRKVG